MNLVKTRFLKFYTLVESFQNVIRKKIQRDLNLYYKFRRFLNFSFCAAASVGKLYLKKVLRSIIIFNKTIETFLKEVI